MLNLLRRYWRAILIAAVFAAGAFVEWTSANGPPQHSYAAAAQIPALATSQPPTVTVQDGEKPNKTDAKGNPDVARNNSRSAPNSVPLKDLTFAPRITVYANPSSANGEGNTAHDYIDYALVGLGIFVAALTYLAVNRQADIMAGTLKQMGEDAKLARDEFNATHRPRIIIYAFQITEDFFNDGSDSKVGARIYYVNDGTTPATITKIEVGITRKRHSQMGGKPVILTEFPTPRTDPLAGEKKIPSLLVQTIR